ncbi:unnamed protein product [Rotaria sordida]|uniref:Uncharacterized protein n=1 Tax=Rotaria sordida TaxID=392033 RepID=A0A818WNC5_9BILA|nr:unnamed protein product [Rotaria sordida]
MLQSARGRGRGRQTTNSNGISLSPASTTSSGVSLSPTSSTKDDNQSESEFSSSSMDSKSSTLPQRITYDVRGRGRPLQRDIAPDDPYWTVSNLTNTQFHSNIRPTKPDKLGTLGQQIQVIVNYFPILQFPHKGLVYKYHIQIRHKKNLEIHREHRR